MSAKFPAFQFYPADWAKDPNLRRCKKAEKGLWVDMLCLMHECEERGFLVSAGTPWSDEEIAEAAGGDKAENLLLLAGLLAKGVARRDGRGAIYNARMARDESLRRIRQKCGKLGGNPNLLNQKSTGRVKQKQTTRDNQSPTPSTSTSSSASSSTSDPNLPPDPPRNKSTGDGFAKPILAEVSDYCRERGNSVDPVQWMAYYESNGWKVGRNPMLNWKAAVITWEKNSKGDAHGSFNHRGTRARQLEVDARELLREFRGGLRVQSRGDASQVDDCTPVSPHGDFIPSTGSWTGAHVVAG